MPIGSWVNPILFSKSNDSEKDTGKKLGGSDFDRSGGDDEPSDMDTERPADEPEDEVPGKNAPDQDEFRFKSDHKYPGWWEDEDPEDWSDEDFDAAVDELEKIQNPSEDEKWAEKAKLKKMDDDEREEYLNRKQDHVRGLQSKIADAEMAVHDKKEKRSEPVSSDDYNDALDNAGVSSDDSIDDVRDKDWDDLQYDIATSAAEKYGLNDPAAVYDYMKQKGGYNTVQDVIDNADEIGKRYTKGGKGIKDSIQINGKKYRPIKESKKPQSEEKDFTQLLQENYKRFSRK